MSNELTPPNQPTDPTTTDLAETGSNTVNPTIVNPTAVDPTEIIATTETGSTMDLPFIEALPATPAVTPEPVATPTATSTPTPPTAAPVEQTPAYATTAYEPPVRREAPILRGPSPWTVVYGLIALAVAVVVFITTATTTDIDWGTAGPATVVGFGVVLVLLGLLGMRSRRRLGA